MTSTERYRETIKRKYGREVRKMNYKKITKQYLQSLGIQDIILFDDNQYDIVCEKNYTIVYQKYNWTQKNTSVSPRFIVYINSKAVNIALGTLFYAWFIGDVDHNKYVVDHIDEDPFNNKLDNL